MLADRKTCFAAALLAVSLLTSPASADVKAGVDAWQAGNYSAAVREWRPFADKGNPDAQFNMGQAYKLGRGTPVDLKIAQSWYEKAAAQGHAAAQANLGLILYESGKRAQAMPWLNKAANNGDARAQYALGTALFNGEDIKKDMPRAYAMMTLAAGQGHPHAVKSLTQMDQLIPLGDRQRGTALARQIETRTEIAVRAPSPPKPQRPAVVPAAKPVAKPAPPAAKPVAVAAGGWRVQLGAFGSPALARGQWATLSRKIGGLAGLQPSYEPAGKLTRLRVGVGSRAAADRVCASAKAAGQACFPVAP